MISFKDGKRQQKGGKKSALPGMPA